MFLRYLPGMRAAERILNAIMHMMFHIPQAYVPGTPSTISGLNATAIRRVAYEKKLREDSIRPSVFTQLKTAIKVVDSVVNIVKSGIWMEISTPPDSGQSCRIAMRKPLRAAPRYGNSNAILGNEDEQDLVWTELYYNEVKKGIKYKKWGYDYNDTKYLKYIETYGSALSEYMAELRDTHIHQALMLTYDEGLTNSPVNNAQQFNKNWIIPNLAESAYPSWDITALTKTDGSVDADGYYSSRSYGGATSFVQNIADALMTAAGSGSTSKATLNVDTLMQVKTYLTDSLQLEPIMLDGIPSYICLIPPKVLGWTMNPNKSGGLGEHMQAVSDYKDPKRPSLIGEMGRVLEQLVFVQDFRAPTLTVGGAYGSYTLSVGYMNPGNNDDRNNVAWTNTSGATNFVFDMMLVCGANALAEYLVDPLVSNLAESTEYGQIQGRGAYLGCGIQIPAFDKDAAGRLDGASTTQIQKGSCLVPISRNPIVTVS